MEGCYYGGLVFATYLLGTGHGCCVGVERSLKVICATFWSCCERVRKTGGLIRTMVNFVRRIVVKVCTENV